jgi:hypothetical protein
MKRWARFTFWKVTMKGLVCLTFLVLVASTVLSCAQSTPTPAISDEMIKPGDRVGDLLVTTGEVGDFVFFTRITILPAGAPEPTG